MWKKFKDLNNDEKIEYYKVTNKIYRMKNRERINAATCLLHYYNIVKTNPVKMRQRSEKNRERYHKTLRVYNIETNKMVHYKEKLRADNFIVSF